MSIKGYNMESLKDVNRRKNIWQQKIKVCGY